ncbi:MAG TPA: excinuclease ABC subunit UvrC [Candidatus Rifleibacterium sp.]|nr:excinuclease ABC subunit UvrC [Candidatus Rifleibacterium sp.]HPT48357.1 excinuclease ABC subunit UvrC [Candidatus Rifleibacterium sp.]
MEKEKLAKILAMMPPDPGVYLMKNRVGEIIYIGKSRSLKKRVRSYFNRHHDNMKTSVLVSAIEDIEFIITGNEVEALILENNLIKKNHPRYNILLKDSKTHPYIKVTLKEAFPRLEKVRKVVFRDGNQYFGPFPNEYDLTRIIDLLSRNFRLCTAHKNIVAGRKVRPCLKYHLGVCQGICQGNVTPEEYAVAINKAVEVLSGRADPDFSGLEKQLRDLVAQFRYEEAAEIRDTLTALQRFFASQKVEFLKPVNLDFWGMSEANDRLIFSVFFIRGGKLLGNRILDVEREPENSNQEVLTTVICRFYDTNIIPTTIYCGHEPEGLGPLLAMLSEKAGRKVSFHIPRKGQFLSLLAMADNNAHEVLRNLKSEGNERIDESVLDLQHLLELKVPPVRIECVDISHIQGTDPVASLVVCHNGRPRKGEYRLFHIKSAQGGDDPASIAEVTRRRFTRLLKEHATLPDLYIVDGGITQVRAACRELNELGIDIEVLGLAKREETLVKPDGTGVNLPFSSSGMKSIIKLRNEAHRFANTFQKKTHNRKVLRSSLLNLPGVGPATLRKALWEFGSMANLARASVEELQKRCQIPLKTAEVIIASLKETNDEKAA